MKKMLLTAGLMVVMSSSFAETAVKKPFLWGAASAAYQVEGSPAADGKGRSVWDYYLDEKSLAGPGVSGNVAINFYDREQYLQDIAIFKKMGLNN